MQVSYYIHYFVGVQESFSMALDSARKDPYVARQMREELCVVSDNTGKTKIVVKRPRAAARCFARDEIFIYVYFILFMAFFMLFIVFFAFILFIAFAMISKVCF